VLEIHRRTGYLLLATLVAQIILISAQVRTTSGTRVLQAVTSAAQVQEDADAAYEMERLGVRAMSLAAAHQS